MLPADVRASDPNVDLSAGPVSASSTKTGSEEGVGYGSPMVVHASSFHNDGGAADQFFMSFSGGYVYGKNGGTCMQAPIHLPVGAEMISFYANVIDNAATDLTVTLFRKYVSTNTASEQLASVTSSGTSTTPTSLYTGAIATPIVPSQYYHYYITFCLPDDVNMKFINARVYYIDG
jgi:hypothetical protein